MDKTATEVVLELVASGMEKEANIGPIRNVGILKELLRRSKKLNKVFGMGYSPRGAKPGSIADSIFKGNTPSPETIRGSLPRSRGNKDIFDNVLDKDLIDASLGTSALHTARRLRNRARLHMYNNRYDMINWANPTSGPNWAHYKKWVADRGKVNSDDLNALTDLFVK